MSQRLGALLFSSIWCLLASDLNPKFIPCFFPRSWLPVAVQSVTEAQAKRFAKYRERVSRIEKDVVSALSLPEAFTSRTPPETLR